VQGQLSGCAGKDILKYLNLKDKSLGKSKKLFDRGNNFS
jgi:hypothetical protein